MKTQNGLPVPSVLDISPVATISRLFPPEHEGEITMGLAQPGTDIYEAAGHARVVQSQRNYLLCNDALPRNNFALQLQREKRRAERSKRPLSIVVYRIKNADNDMSANADACEFLELLHCASRETDIIGHVGSGLIAVLCPDTDEQGINAYIRKVEELIPECRYETEAATYPDKLFEKLSQPGKLGPALHQIVSGDFGQRHQGYRLKRSLDVFGATLLILLLSPLMLFVALLVAATSTGPIIFKQMRLGTGGKPFAFYKFRSMVVTMDDSIHRQFVADLIKGEINAAAQGNDNGPAYKIRSDPRVTWIGRIIRKTSIDELPQLFNVLKGDMSLVGPRPPIPYEAEIYEAWHLRRILSAKPGITGLWQVQARSTVTFNEMVRLDLRYIRECSLLLDLKILMKTIGVVLRCDGAV